MDLERPNRVVPVRRRENHDGPVVLGQRIEHAESIETRHFDIEKNDVGSEPLDGLHRRGSIDGFAGNLDSIDMCSKQALEPAARFALIVDDQDALFHETTLASRGKTSTAFVPAGFICSRLRLADSP